MSLSLKIYQLIVMIVNGIHIIAGIGTIKIIQKRNGKMKREQKDCPKCSQSAKFDGGNLEMDILAHYYCGDCMIWTENRHTSIWTDGCDEWKSNGTEHHTRLCG